MPRLAPDIEVSPVAAAEHGAKRAYFEELLKEAEPSAQVDRHMETAANAGIRGTPHFRVNGHRSNWKPDAIRETIEHEMLLAQAVLDEGLPPGCVYGARVRGEIASTQLACGPQEAKRQACFDAKVGSASASASRQGG